MSQRTNVQLLARDVRASHESGAALGHRQTDHQLFDVLRDQQERHAIGESLEHTVHPTMGDKPSRNTVGSRSIRAGMWRRQRIRIQHDDVRPLARQLIQQECHQGVCRAKDQAMNVLTIWLQALPPGYTV